MPSVYRRTVGSPVCYFTDNGTPYALSGSPSALYVQLAPTDAKVVTFNPVQAPAVPLLQAMAVPGQAVEVFAADYRTAPNPPIIYLQLFDSLNAPVSGTTQPLMTALPLCKTAAYDWSTDNILLTNGLWVALSSTPLIYTALAASQDFSITARVVPS
jgi:hypothetical protein